MVGNEDIWELKTGIARANERGFVLASGDIWLSDCRVETSTEPRSVVAEMLRKPPGTVAFNEAHLVDVGLRRLLYFL